MSLPNYPIAIFHPYVDSKFLCETYKTNHSEFNWVSNLLRTNDDFIVFSACWIDSQAIELQFDF